MKSRLGPIQRQKLYEEVYRRLRMAILTGKLQPSEHLHEQQLAEELGVSRTPVRESVLQLEREGLLRRDSRSGFVVTPITKRDVIDAYACRGAVEGLLILRVIEKLKPSHLDLLEEIVRKTDAALQADNIEMAMYHNTQFHESLVEIADSHIFRSLSREIWTCIERYRHAALSLFAETPYYRKKYLGLLKKVLHDHQNLLLALRAGDADKARLIMEQHGPKVGKGVMECIAPLSDDFRPMDSTWLSEDGDR